MNFKKESNYKISSYISKFLNEILKIVHIGKFKIKLIFE